VQMGLVVHRKMAQGAYGKGGWNHDGAKLRHAARRRGDSPNAKDNFEFDRRLGFRRKSGAD
jgi:hypothetical protein